MSQALKVVYFSVRARAEPLRLILSYGKVNFSNLTVDEYFGKSWGEVKSGDCCPPFGQVPVLDVDGVVLVQSGSLCRYAAKLANMVPSDPIKEAICDAIFQTAEELSSVNPLVNVFKGDTFVEKKTFYLETTLPSKLVALNKILGNQRFFCGETPSYADCSVYHHLDNTRFLDAERLKDYVNITEWMARFEQLDGINEYLRNRLDVCDIGVKPMLAPTLDTTTIQTTPRTLL